MNPRIASREESGWAGGRLSGDHQTGLRMQALGEGGVC